MMMSKLADFILKHFFLQNCLVLMQYSIFPALFTKRKQLVNIYTIIYNTMKKTFTIDIIIKTLSNYDIYNLAY